MPRSSGRCRAVTGSGWGWRTRSSRRPPILILDEPTVGLDPNQIRETRALIRELGRERTILLSTHVLPEVEAVATRVIILNSGRVVAAQTQDELRAAWPARAG